MAERTPLPWEAVAAKYADNPAKLEDARNRYFQVFIAPKYGANPDAILAAREEWDANTAPKTVVGRAVDAVKGGLSSAWDATKDVAQDVGAAAARIPGQLGTSLAQSVLSMPGGGYGRVGRELFGLTPGGKAINEVRGKLAQAGAESDAFLHKELATPTEQAQAQELGNILRDPTLGEVEKAATVLGHQMSNPRNAATNAITSLGMMAFGMGYARQAATAAGSVAAQRAAEQVIARGGTIAEAKLAADALGKSAAERAALHGAMGSNATMEAGAAWNQTYLEAKQAYAGQIGEDGGRLYSPAEVERLARRDADKAAPLAGVLSTVAEKALGGYKLETAVGAGKKIPVVRAGVTEATGEAGSGGGSQFAQNVAAAGGYEPGRGLMDQVAAQGVLEATAAGVTGPAIAGANTAMLKAQEIVARPRGAQAKPQVPPGGAPAAPGAPPAAPAGDVKAERPTPVKAVAKPPKGEQGPTVYGDDLPDLSMQERDRSKAAPVAQMTAIAQSPDFDRIGPSNSSEIGAPMVSVKGGGTVAEGDIGRQETVLFPDGTKVPARYAVVEADTVLASHSADGRKNADYYAAQPGAVVALNNARTAGMQEAYRRGTADGYRAKLAEQAQALGINPAAIAGKKNPLLVRVYDDAVNAQADLGRLSNTSHALQKSAAEIAFNDARLLDPANIDRAGGDPLSNEALVKQFLSTVPDTERGALTGADGQPTKQLRQRLDDAIFARAYRSPEMSNMAIEDADPDVKSVLDGMRQAAGAWARVAGAGKLDMRTQVVRGAWGVIDAKQRGLKPSEALAQIHMFGRDPLQDAVTRMLADNIRSPKKMGLALRTLAEVIDQAATEKDSMFAGSPPTARDLIAKTNSRLAKTGEGAPQFALPAEDVPVAARTQPSRAPKDAMLLSAMNTPAEQKKGLPSEAKFEKAQRDHELPADMVADVRAMYEEASAAYLDYAARVQKAQDALGGTAIVAPLKGPVRAYEKLLEAVKRKKSARTELKDILRSTVVIVSQDEVQTAIDAVLAQFPGAIVKRNLLEPGAGGLGNTGYHDVLINVPVGNMKAEVQINFPDMLDLKEGKGHELYEQQRPVKDKIEREDREATPEEAAFIDRLDAEQFAVYDPAWRIFNASSSEIGRPSPNDEIRISSGGAPGSIENPGTELAPPGKNLPRGMATTRGESGSPTSENIQAPVGEGGSPSRSAIINSPSVYNSNEPDTGSQEDDDTPRALRITKAKQSSTFDLFGGNDGGNGGNGSSGAKGPGTPNIPRPPSSGNPPDLGKGKGGGDQRGNNERGNVPGGGNGLPKDGRDGSGPSDKRAPSDGGGKGTRGTSARDRKLRAKSGANYRFGPDDLTYEGGAITKARQNIAAIKLLKELEREGRQATRAEQAVLAKYIGWGDSQIANPLFNVTTQSASWQQIRDELRDLLTEQEWKEASASTRFAHYTSREIVRSMWGAMQRMGFAGGAVLEPGAGIGVFNGLMPAELADNSAYTGIELEPIAGGILKQLNPDENIKIESYFKTTLPHDFFDVAIGNPPFSTQAVISDPEYRKQAFSLHDYFFAKTLDRVKPGGLLVFVTSRYTMDKKNDKGRKYLAERADLVGAIRLPQTAFKKNAGTEVVTDVLFLRKKVPGEVFDKAQSWAESVPIKIGGKAAMVNEYFAKHPEMILGKPTFAGSMYSADEYTVEPIDGDIEQQFAAAAASLPENVYVKELSAKARDEQAKALDLDPKIKKQGSFYLTDVGVLMRVDRGVGVRVEDQKNPVLRAYIPMRDALKQAMHDQLTDGDWEKSLANLRRVYDRFVAAHGKIKENTPYYRTRTEIDPVTGEDVEVERKYRRFKNLSAISEDPEHSLVMSLEELDEESDVITRARAMTQRVLNQPKTREINSVEDALLAVLNDTGAIDMDRVAELAALSRDQAIESLGTLIYETPGGKWRMADDYLSGNVVRKLDEALEAVKTDARFERNVEALRAVQPTPMTPKEIDVRIGMSWFPIDEYLNFAREVGKVRGRRALEISRSPATGEWTVASDDPWALRESPYTVDGADFADIMRAALTGEPIVVTRRVPDGHGGMKTEVDKDASLLAEQKRAEMQRDFGKWFWASEDRRDKYAPIYNREFNNLVPRKFDGRHLTLPGTSSFVNVFDHVKRGVWRIIQTGNTYLAHAVGSGKTFQMVASAMEQKRLGLISKPMMVVPNHMLQQFTSEWMQLYPGARLMVADEKAFTGENRRRWVSQVALSDVDGVIITHSAFGLLDLDPDFKIGLIEEELDLYRAALMEVAGRPDLETNRQGKRIYSRDPKVKVIEHALEKLRQRLDAAMNAKGKDTNVRFDQLGVDMLYVDEAHLFRRLPFITKRQMKGIQPQGSNRAFDLWLKTRWLERKNPGRSIVMASGTPITNTIAEMFTVKRFMAPDALEARGLGTFDAWASMYGREETDLEPKVDGSYEPVTRFSKFANIRSLINSFREFADVLTSSDLALLLGDKRPRVPKGREIIVVPQSAEFKEYQQEELATRVEDSKNWKPSPGEMHNPDPIINIISDGRFAALDMRFTDPTLPPDPNSKLNTMIRNVIQTWRDTRDYEYNGKDGKPEPTKGATQIIFSDIGFGEGAIANRRFDSRAWMVKSFMEAGIPASEIAFMSDFKASQDKLKLFKRVNEGKVRILIGSSKNMGTGVNAQQRLIELHHLDTPWLPADVEQREGRIIRTGNKNPNVRIKGYTMKGSFDETMWGLVARKQRFIEQALSGDQTIDTLEDVGEASQYEMAAAMTAKDPRVLVLAGLRAEAARLMSMYEAHTAGVDAAKRDLRVSSGLIEAVEKRWLPRAEARAAQAQDITGDKFTGKVGDTTYTKRQEWGEAIKRLASDLRGGDKVKRKQVGEVGGLPVFATVEGEATIFMDAHDSESLVSTLLLPMMMDADPMTIAMKAQREIALTRQEPDVLKAKVAEYRAHSTVYETRANQPFPYLEELREKQAKVYELEDDITNNPIGDDDDDVPVAKRQAPESEVKLRVALVRAAADEILKRWASKPNVVVLGSMDEAPEAIRDYFATDQAEGEGEVAGVFHKGTIYLVANALATPYDVLRVMAHEGLGHYGLRGLYGDSLRGILSDLVAARQADVRKVAQSYGLDWSKPNNRLIAAEELLVSLAETRPGLGFVRRTIAAVRTWLRGVGAPLTISDDELINNFILPARQFVEGGPKGPKRGAYAAPPAGNRNPFLPNSAQADGFRASLRFALSNMANALRQNIPLVVGNVSPVLRTIGVPEGKVRILPAIVEKVMKAKRSQDGAHGITAEQLEMLPEWLSDPIAVFKSKNNYDAWAVLSSLKDEDGEPIMAAVQLRGDPKRGGGAFVTSVYGRKERQYANWVAEGLLLYHDDTKGSAPFASPGGGLGQFPSAGRAGGVRQNVLLKSVLVNPPRASRFPAVPTTARLAQQMEFFPSLAAPGERNRSFFDEFSRQREEWVKAIADALGDEESAAVHGSRGGYHLMSRNAHFPEVSKNEWRVTHFDDNWIPQGHDEYKTKFEATEDMIATYGNDEIPVAARRRIAGQLTAGKGLLDNALRLPVQALKLDKATALAWDKIIELAGKVVPEKVKAGMVDRYGVPEDVIDARRDLETGKRVMLRKAENLLAKMATMSRDESRVLYAAATEKSPHVVAKMVAALPQASRDVLYEIKDLVQSLTDQQVALGLLDPEVAKRNEWGYLHRTYLEHETNLTPGEQKARQRVRGLLGDAYRGRGLFDSLTGAEVARWSPSWWGQKFPGGNLTPAAIGENFIRYEKRDTPLPGMGRGKLRDVVYLPATVKPSGAYSSYDPDADGAVWTISDVKGGEAVLRRDFTPDERKAMGEIDEIRYALTKTLHLAMHNVEMGRYLKMVADGHSRSLPPAGAVVVEGSSDLRAAYAPGVWARVPDTKLPGTDVPKYGALAGRYLPGPVWNDVRMTRDWNSKPFGETYAKILRMWKISKTALSPAVHMNNVMANFVLADWQDVGASHVARAGLALLKARRGDAGAQATVAEFEDNGGNGGTWAIEELQAKQLEPLLEDLLQQAQAGAGHAIVGVFAAVQAARAGEWGKAWEAAKGGKVVSGGKTAARAMMQLYQNEDVLFRFAAYLKARDDGLSKREAGKFARDAFLDYEISAPWVQAARQTALPFVSFIYRALPKMVDTAARKPWKLAKLLLVTGALNAIGFALSGGDEDKERKLLPEEKAGRLFFGVPKLIRMPWNDDNGNPVFLDIRRWIPVGDVFDVGQNHAALPMLPMAIPAGPVAVFAELFANRSQFTGKDITKETDTGWEKILKVADHLFKAFSPNLLLPGPGYAVPGTERGQLQTYAWQGAQDAATGRTDAFGRELSLPQALGNAVGVKLGAYAEDAARQRLKIDFDRQKAEITGEIRGSAKEFARRGISEEDFRAKVERQSQKLRDLSNRTIERAP